MRTIRFRGKPCYKGGKQSPWVYGTFQYIAQRRVKQGATDNGTFEPRNDKGCIVDLYGIKTEVLCDTIGQFTGILDKNGKEIYEGDIVKYWVEDTRCINPDCDAFNRIYESFLKKIVEEVSFEDSMFVCGDYYPLTWCGIHKEQLEEVRNDLNATEEDGWSDCDGNIVDESILGIEVIGNIYDNPEL